MNPKVYVDYTINVGFKASMGEVAQAASLLIKALHAGFVNMPGCFALDFPMIERKSPRARISVFRVFAATVEDQQKLHTFLEHSGLLENRVKPAFPKTVPESFTGPYRVISRIRIRGRSRGIERLTTMKSLEEKGNIWFQIHSTENGHNFRFYIDHETHNQCEGPASTTSYGLSYADKPFFVPAL